MTLSEAMDIAEKINNTATNTQEMVKAVDVLISFAEQYSFLAVKDDGEDIDYE